jgi:hypothetical protein
MNTVGEPDEGKPHVRFDERRLAKPATMADDLGACWKRQECTRRPTVQGWTSRLLYQPLLGAPLAEYSARRMSYDLSRLVRKQVIARVAGTHRYVLTENGRRLALTFAGTYRRILIPVLGELARDDLGDPPRPLGLAWRRVTRELDRYIDAAAA